MFINEIRAAFINIFSQNLNLSNLSNDWLFQNGINHFNGSLYLSPDSYNQAKSEIIKLDRSKFMASPLTMDFALGYDTPEGNKKYILSISLNQAENQQEPILIYNSQNEIIYPPKQISEMNNTNNTIDDNDELIFEDF